METTRHVRAVRHIQAGLCALVIFFVLGTPPAGAAEGAAKASSSLAQFPDRVELVRPIFGSDGLPLSGRHDVTLTYFDKAGIGLYAESLPAVDVTDGQLRVALGSGKTVMAEEYQSLQAVFAAHPEVDLEISVDGHVQSPRIGLLPAGHSVKSRLVSAGVRDDDDDEQHWKHYQEISGATATQAATLNPAGPPRSAQAEISDQGFYRRPFTTPVLGPFLSRQVRDLPVVTQKPPGKDREINRPRQQDLLDARGRPFGTAARRQNDLLVAAGDVQTPALQTPALGFGFDGISNFQGFLPPDIEGAVGPNHFLQVVNVAFAVYDKTGVQLHGPVATNTLWSGFGGVCESENSGDAIFMYDEAADRWVLSQFAVQTTFTVCFAVSQTADPLGSYYLYEVTTPRFPDYYKLGVWPDPNNNAYFMGTNSGLQGQYDVFAVDRASMLAGTAVRPTQFFQNFVNLMMPADLDAWQTGAGAPPSGSPGLFYTMRDGGESYFGSPPSDSIDVWEFDVDWDTPANSTFSRIEVITPAEGLADFNWTICGFFEGSCPGGNAIPQPGTAQKLDSASWWPMQRLVYQNYGAYESLFGTWTVDVLASGDLAAPRWFELRRSGSGWSIYDQGTHSPDAIHRWMPSIAADISGNIALGYSRGDDSNYASVYYATRETTDPPGTLQAEAEMHPGTGAQTHSSGRWGDYSSMELDPTDGCTFWFTTEYLQTTGSAPWRTRVGVFSIPSCGGPRFALGCSPNDFTTNLGDAETSTCDVSAFNGYTDPVTLSCVGLPVGVSCGFDTNSTNAPYSSLLTITTDGTVTLGSNAFTVEATDGVTTKSVPMTVNVYPVGSNGPQEALYDAGLGAPLCSVAGSECDSTSLLDGRASLGPEPNQPNSLDACTDGASGSYHSDESNDRLVVRSIDGVSNLVEGATAVVEATVYAWSTGSDDTLDLYYAADANNPNWVLIGSQTPPAGGSQTLTAQYTLPTGGLQAVRANFRYQGTQSPCSGGAYDDTDDLVFAVESPVQCVVDADCDNGLYCDGAEICDAGVCQAGTVPACDNGLYCDGTETCNETTDSCDAGTAPVCDNGLYCDGTETCNEGTDSCDAGTSVVCDDGLFCNGTDTCNETTDSCDAGTAPVCDNGLYCDGTETCNEGTDSCDAGTPVVCDDGAFCNGAETCNEGTDSCDAGTPPEDDGVGCTDDSCDEGTDTVTNTPNDAYCGNGAFCDGVETCDAVLDCQAGTDPCAGGVCNETTDICEVTTNTVHVASVETGTINAGRGLKTGTATVTLADSNGSPVGEFYEVFGNFGGTWTEGASDFTDGLGVADFQTTGDPQKGVTVTFCVSDVDGSGAVPSLVYDENDNAPGTTCGALPFCGDELAEAPEECDGPDLGDASCLSLGFDGGSLSCSLSCTFDTSACTGGQCVATHSKEKGPRCSDGLDNDCDNLIDGDDPDC